jgi:hypothetical protein
MVAAMDVSVSQQLVRVALETLGCSPKQVVVHGRPYSTEFATTAFIEYRVRYEADERRFIFSVDGACFGRNAGTRMGIRGAGYPLYLPWNPKTTRISSLFAAGDSFRGLSFALRESSHNSTHFIGSLKTFPLMSADVRLLDDVAFRH